MFSAPDHHQIHDVLLRILQDRRKWHDAKFAAKAARGQFATIPSKRSFHKDTFAWYGTLEKNISHYLQAVLKLEKLEADQLNKNDLIEQSILTPHKIKQLVIIKLVAEMGHLADELKNILKSKDSSKVDRGVLLRRRIRWLEVKLDSLTREPLMSASAVQRFYVHDHSSAGRSTAQLSASPTFIVSVGSADDGQSLTSSDSDTSSSEEENVDEEVISPSRYARLKQLGDVNRESSDHESDAADQYWSSEHHQIEQSPLTGVFGLTYHSLDTHRSHSYVKDRGDPVRASLPWQKSSKEYVDPNSEEKALERLSVTVQEMMGRAYTAALESIPLDPEEVRAIKKAKVAVHSKIDYKRPNSILAKMKGQKWLEKKFRNAIHTKDMMVYHPPPEPIPVKLLLAKLSDEVYPPIPTSDLDVLRQRAKNMPPRFINQHDLLKKTHLTLYELIFDVENVRSKVDVRKGTDLMGRSQSRTEASLAPSASVTRGPYDFGGVRPKSPGNGTVTTKQKSKQGRKTQDFQILKEFNAPPRRLPPVAETARTLVLPTSQKDRVYMTKSGWYYTRRMPAPMQYIAQRLERVKELIVTIKKENVTNEQKIASVKQIAALGVTNTEVINDLVSMISSSPQRSSSMDLRFEILKLMLLLGFTEDAVLKELLVFISSSNHQILIDLLRSLRKALSSPRMARPFGKLTAEAQNAPDLHGKCLNLLYVSPTDCLIVHRLVQLAQCMSPELSFFAASCLRKVRVMPPPPPLAPPPLPEQEDTTASVSSNSVTEDYKSMVLAHAEYSEKLEEYQNLLHQIDEQAREIANLTELTLRQIAKSGTPIVIEALNELIDGIGATEDEVYKIAYDLMEKSSTGAVRANLVRILADGFIRMTAESIPGVEFRLNDFQEILVNRLVRDPDKAVWTECARALYKLGLYDKISENVMKNLDNKLDMETKMEAIQCAVGLRMRGARVTRALVDLLELDPNDGVRVAACRALAMTGTNDRRALAALRERYERTQGVVAREAGKAIAALTTTQSSTGNATFNPAFLDALVDRAVKNG